MTADTKRKAEMTSEFEAFIRPDDAIVAGNWQDEHFLEGQVFDYVIEDYLLGAVEGFAPYFQHNLFRRLRPHVGKALLLIGLEPYPEGFLAPGDTSSPEYILRETIRLRDATLLLAKRRVYREYPMDWIVAHMEDAGFTVVEAMRVPLSYGKTWVNAQLQVALDHITKIDSFDVVSGLQKRIEEVRELAKDMPMHMFGEHHVICAVPAGSTGHQSRPTVTPKTSPPSLIPESTKKDL